MSKKINSIGLRSFNSFKLFQSEDGCKYILYDDFQETCDNLSALIDDFEKLEMDNRILSMKLEECQTELQQYKAYCIELENKLSEYSKKGGFNHELQEVRKDNVF